MKDYSQPFWIEGPRGNNAFAYEQRGEKPRLYVPSLREGTLEDVRVGSEVVFSDVDEQGVLQQCVGLESFIRTTWHGIPLVVVDNHNHVFYFWMEAILAGRLGKCVALVHVDQHKDMREPPQLFEGQTLEEVFDYTNGVLNVGNYIVPAMQFGMVKALQLVTSEMTLEDKTFLGLGPKILNVDLDFFAPEMDYIAFQKARDFIRAHAQEASLITVATSPFFIDQERALEKLRQIFE